MASDPANTLRVAVDATVLIAGSGWPRWPYEVLLAGLREDIRLVVSPFVVEQARRNIRRKFPEHLPRLEEFLSSVDWEVLPEATLAEIKKNTRLIRDVDDIPVVLPAIKAGVDCMVSEDKDLTAQDQTTALLRQKLTVLLSGTFLRRVMGWTSEQLEAIRYRKWSDLED